MRYDCFSRKLLVIFLVNHWDLLVNYANKFIELSANPFRTFMRSLISYQSIGRYTSLRYDEKIGQGLDKNCHSESSTERRFS